MQLPDPSSVVPDSWFDREWALAVMARGLESVERSFREAGKERHFAVLKPWLIGETEGLSQAEAAARLDLTPAAVKVAVHRLRQKFRDAIESEIAQTVNEPAEVAEELRYLIEVLS